jgi:Integrase core domain
VFADADIEVLRSPPRAPKANAYAERWVSTVRRECLDRMLIVNRRHLVRVLTEYEKHYNGHRPHRALKQLSPDADVKISGLGHRGFAAGYLSFNVRGKPAGMAWKDWRAKRWKTQIRGAHEPLIDDATWRRYQNERRKRERVRPMPRQPKWFLGGIARCGYCDWALIVSTYSYGKPSLAICNGHRMKRDCPGVWINRKFLELCVEEDWLMYHVKWLAHEYDAMSGRDDERALLAKELADINAEKERVDNGLRAALGLVIQGLSSYEHYKSVKREAHQKREQLAQRGDDLQYQLEMLDPTADPSSSIGANASAARPDRRLSTCRPKSSTSC